MVINLYPASLAFYCKYFVLTEWVKLRSLISTYAHYPSLALEEKKKEEKDSYEFGSHPNF